MDLKKTTPVEPWKLKFRLATTRVRFGLCQFFILIFNWIPVATASTNRTLSEQLKDAADEVGNLSPVALTILVGPIVSVFLLVIICYCICCKVRQMKRRGTSDFEGITVLKAPPGQPAPIPLTGMVNQPRGGFPKLTSAPQTTSAKSGIPESARLV